mmetsp:Transcript_4542/g.8784  ORF Transcript_4542/g.8784 Transcript_4542/m.8784 type:complete len:196 (+) Transcript_4542:130-717(+)
MWLAPAHAPKYVHSLERASRQFVLGSSTFQAQAAFSLASVVFAPLLALSFLMMNMMLMHTNPTRRTYLPIKRVLGERSILAATELKRDFTDSTFAGRSSLVEAFVNSDITCVLAGSMAQTESAQTARKAAAVRRVHTANILLLTPGEPEVAGSFTEAGSGLITSTPAGTLLPFSFSVTTARFMAAGEDVRLLRVV